MMTHHSHISCPRISPDQSTRGWLISGGVAFLFWGGTISVPDSHNFSVRDRISWDVSICPICFVPIDHVSWQDTSKGELHVKAWLEHETQGGYPSTPSAVWEFEVL